MIIWITSSKYSDLTIRYNKSGNGIDNKSNNDRITSSIQAIGEETKHIYQEDSLIYSFASQMRNGCSIEDSTKRILKKFSWSLKFLISQVKLNKQKLIYFAILKKTMNKLTSNDIKMIFGEFKEDKSKPLWRCFLQVTQLNKKMRLGEYKWKQSNKQAEELQVSHNIPISEYSEIVPIEYHKDLFLNFKSNRRQ